MATARDDLVDGFVAALRTAGVEIGSVGGENFRLVVAQRLLASDFFREAMSEAWDEGYATCLGDFDIAARREARSANPYRD